MIRQLIFEGFKDQTRKVALTGLDLFTSNNINGVGKSAILEAFKLVLLGEIPGRAKNLDDILKFTSQDEIRVEALAEQGTERRVIERCFLKEAKQGERRPIRIDQAHLKFEEGNYWIRENIGAVSIAFDPQEFLGLSAAKKLQWVISHSPESWSIDKDWVRMMAVAYFTKRYLGSGLLNLLLQEFAMKTMEDLFDRSEECAPITRKLEMHFESQEPERWERIRRILDAAFQTWSSSLSAQDNLKLIQKLLKSAVIEKKTMIREQAGAVACIRPEGGEGSAIDSLKSDLECCENELESLTAQFDVLTERHAAAEAGRREEAALQKELEELKRGLNAQRSAESYDSEWEQLERDKMDLDRLQQSLNDMFEPQDSLSEQCRKQEAELAETQRQLNLRRNTVEAAQAAASARCPIAESIRCETDMTPYQETLEDEIRALTKNLSALEEENRKTQESLAEMRAKREHLQKQLKEGRDWNRSLESRQAGLLEKRNAAEVERIRAESRMMACNETLQMILNQRKANPIFPEQLDQRVQLQAKKQELLNRRRQVRSSLDQALKEDGKRQAVEELKCARADAEQDLDIIKQAESLFGPSGLQGDIVERAATGLQDEAGEILRLIDPDLDFAVDFTGKDLQMGWNRQGKLIPFDTLNSGHFVLFMVPFLTALISRLARFRMKSHQRTLRALCIEAESLTPNNLRALLKGLSKMKVQGYLDNVLVAHYASIGEAEGLSGFKEHIIEEPGGLTLAA